MGELGTKLAVTSNRCTLLKILEAIRYSETLALTRATRRYISEDGILSRHRREDVKSYIVLTD
jgi:hypothetical protein